MRDGDARRAGRTAGFVVLAALLLLAGLWYLRGPRDGATAPAGSPPSAAAPVRSGRPLSQTRSKDERPAPAPPALSFSLPPGASRKERAKFALASYLDWARYPPTSRPARERPDRQKPHSAPARKLPLSKADRSASKISLVLSQSHYYLAGDEAATLTLSCRKDEEPVPCTVTTASAEAAPGAAGHTGGPVPVAFLDDGTGPDRAASDGVWTAMVAPSKIGFADLHGPMLITASVAAAGESGTGNFQLSYTGKPPAVFTGAVRETLGRGSLSLCVGLQVFEAGRYVLDGRVDDAGAETFAFVSFNDMLGTGKQEACLVVFGRLVLDESAKSPFTLRDIEGFLLIEDAFPDRKTIPTLEGPVHTTKAYASTDFAADEWQSLVKDRHVERLKKDVEEAE